MIYGHSPGLNYNVFAALTFRSNATATGRTAGHGRAATDLGGSPSPRSLTETDFPAQSLQINFKEIFI